MSDLFHEDVPTSYIKDVFNVMIAADLHIYQVLTKRADRLLALAPQLPWASHIWVGVSIENRRFVNRADLLRKVPSAVRFVSAEPLLGPLTNLDLCGIDWLIAGGESGARRRPVKETWIKELRDKCLATGVPFFFKQWGGRTSKAGGRDLDGRLWSEMPEPVSGRLQILNSVGS
jgi:protein gp37